MDEENRKIEEARRYTIEACIVRIVKTEGIIVNDQQILTMNRQSLIARVIGELQEFFHCPAAVVGRCMDRLVEGTSTKTIYTNHVLLKYNARTGGLS